MDLETFTIQGIFVLFLIFCRIGSAVMLLPGIGDSNFAPMSRLWFAIAFSFLLSPVLYHSIPKVPENLITVTVLILGEVIIGIFIGTISRILLLSVMHVAGMINAFQSSLSSALMFDPNQGSQGAVIGIFMVVIATTLFLVADLHHLLLQGLVATYELISPGKFPDMAKYADRASYIVSDSFLAGVKIASPLLILGFFMYLAGGIMARLMPNLQIFFLITPVQLGVAFFILMATISSALMWYLNYYQEKIEVIFG